MAGLPKHELSSKHLDSSQPGTSELPMVLLLIDEEEEGDSFAESGLSEYP